MKRALILLSMLAIVGVTARAEEKGEKGGHDEHRGPPKFEDMDANNDGSISLGEFTESQTKMIEKRFHYMDANNDGKLSKGEIEAGRERWKEHGKGDKDDEHGEHEGK